MRHVHCALTWASCGGRNTARRALSLSAWPRPIKSGFDSMCAMSNDDDESAAVGVRRRCVWAIKEPGTPTGRRDDETAALRGDGWTRNQTRLIRGHHPLVPPP